MNNTVAHVICIGCALVCLLISIFQFMEKGFLFNNAYIYASREQRKEMDKKPHYRQSAIVFALLTAVFLCSELHLLLEAEWLLCAEGSLIAAALIYAIVSGIKIERRK